MTEKNIHRFWVSTRDWLAYGAAWAFGGAAIASDEVLLVVPMMLSFVLFVYWRPR